MSSRTLPMRAMTRTSARLTVFLLSYCYGQTPQIAYRGLFNAASMIPGGLPSGAVARGSAFLITGKNLGPGTTPDLIDPLQTSLGGVSVTVTQGSTTLNAIPLFLSPTGITAIMPSNAPLGAASVRIVYKNVTSNPMPVRVVATQVGIYTANGAGSGRVTDAALCGTGRRAVRHCAARHQASRAADLGAGDWHLEQHDH